MKRIKRGLVALLLLGGVVRAQNVAGPKIRMVPVSPAPAGPSTDVFFWSDSGNANHATLHISGLNIDLLNCGAQCTSNANFLQLTPVSPTVPSNGQFLKLSSGTWAPFNLVVGDLPIGTTSSTVPLGNDARFPPAPSAAGGVVFDANTTYNKSAPGNANQVLIGGAAPSFGQVPNAALPNVGPGAVTTGATRQLLTGILNDLQGRVQTIYALPDKANVYDPRFGTSGAKCDGSTDDQPAIQAAADSCRDGKQCQVYVPASPTNACCMVMNQVVFNTRTGHRYDGIQIVGDGKTVSCIKAGRLFTGGGAGAPIFFEGASFGDLKNIGIRDIRIEGYDSTTTGASPVVAFSNTSGGFAINADVRNNGDAEAVYWGSPNTDTNCLVFNSNFTNVGGWGASVSNGRSAINTNCQKAIVIADTAFQVGSFVEQTGDGYIMLGNNFDTAGVQLGAVHTIGVNLHSPGGGGSPPTGAHGNGLFQGNVVSNAELAVSIGAQSTGNNDTSNNILYNDDQGIVVASAVVGSPNFVDNNKLQGTIAGSQGAGINCTGVGGCSMTGNRIIGGTTPWAYGILINDATAPVIARNNEFWGYTATTAEIYVQTWPGTVSVKLLNNVTLDPAGAIPTNRAIYRLGADGFTTAVYGTEIEWSAVKIANDEPSELWLAAPPAVSTWPVRSSLIHNVAPAPSGALLWSLTTAGACPGTCVWSPLTLN